MNEQGHTGPATTWARRKEHDTMHMKQRTIVWILVLILILPGLASAKRKGRLIGKVMDPEGNPIGSVTVVVTSKQVPGFKEILSTDRKGIFKVDFDVIYVVYLLTFEKPGYVTLNSEQTWRLEGTGRNEFTMVKGADPALDGLPPASASNEAITAFNAGADAFTATDYATAVAKFKESLEHDPELHQAWAALSVTYLEQREYQLTVEAAEQAMALGATDQLALRARWEAYRQLGEKDKAKQARDELEKIMELAEEAKRIYNEGVALAKENDDEGAFAKFSEAHEIDQNLAIARLAVATSGLKVGRFAESAAAAATILEMDPSNDQALRIRYNASLQLGEEDLLLDALVGLAVIEPAIAREGLWRLAIAAYDANDAEKAKKGLAKVLEVSPNHPQAHYHLALIVMNEGDKEEAKAHFERFLALVPPDDPDAITAAELLKYLNES